MSMETASKWMSSAEFNRERLRLFAQGADDEDPRLQSLRERMSRQSSELFERYGRALIPKFPGQHAAIAWDGQWLVAKSAGQLLDEADRRFGEAEYAVFRLCDPPGDLLL